MPLLDAITTTGAYAIEFPDEWHRGGLNLPLRGGCVGLFLSTWEQQHGDALEAAHELGLMAMRSPEGGLHIQ